MHEAPRAPLPTCLVQVSGLEAAQQLILELEKSGEVLVRKVHGTEELVAALHELHPEALVVPTPSSRRAFTAVSTWLRTPGQRCWTLLVGGSAETAARTTRRLANCHWLPESDRLPLAVVDSLSHALRAKPRFQLRASVMLQGELEDEDGRREAIRLMDVSESGAKIAVARQLEIGMPVLLHLHWKDRIFSVEAVPMRKDTVDGQLYAGVQFEELTDELSEAISELAAQVQGEGRPARRAVRFTPPSPLKLKLRVKGAGQSAVRYLELQDLSLTGARGVTQLPDWPFDGRAAVELLLLARGQSLKATARVVRVAEQNDGSRSVAFRFLGLRKGDIKLLRSLITRIQQRPERRSASPTRQSRPALAR